MADVENIIKRKIKQYSKQKLIDIILTNKVLLTLLMITTIMKTIIISYFVVDSSRIILYNILSKNEIYRSIIKLVIFLLTASLIEVINNILMFELQKKTIISFEDLMIAHIYKLENWQIDYNGMKILAIVKNDVKTGVSDYLSLIFGVVQVLMNVLIKSVYSISINVVIYFLCMIIIICVLGVNIRALRKLPVIEKHIGEYFNSTYFNLSEILQNGEIISFLNTSNVLHEYDSNSKDNVYLNKQKGRINANVHITKKIVSVGLVIVTSLIGGLIYIGQPNVAENLSNLLALVWLIPGIASAMLGFVDLSVKKKKILANFQRLDDIFEMREICQHDENMISDISEIEFRNMNFQYNSSGTLIRNFSCKLDRGKIYRLSGDSGTGKSTIVKLLLKLIPVPEKSIYINGEDLIYINRESLWNNVCYLSQNPYVFDSSIEDNIIMTGDYDEERLREVSKITTLDKIIDHFDFGYKTIVTNDSISSGERQKICLARALYQDSSLLIMDEALSAIDINSRRVILNNLKKYVNEKLQICIFISHTNDDEKMYTEELTINKND